MGWTGYFFGNYFWQVSEQPISELDTFCAFYGVLKISLRMACYATTQDHNVKCEFAMPKKPFVHNEKSRGLSRKEAKERADLLNGIVVQAALARLPNGEVINNAIGSGRVAEITLPVEAFNAALEEMRNKEQATLSEATNLLLEEAITKTTKAERDKRAKLANEQKSARTSIEESAKKALKPVTTKLILPQKQRPVKSKPKMIEATIPVESAPNKRLPLADNPQTLWSKSDAKWSEVANEAARFRSYDELVAFFSSKPH